MRHASAFNVVIYSKKRNSNQVRVSDGFGERFGPDGRHMIDFCLQPRVSHLRHRFETVAATVFPHIQQADVVNCDCVYTWRSLPIESTRGAVSCRYTVGVRMFWPGNTEVVA